MEWQLNEVVREEPFFDYTFPLEQMNGANVRLVETMTVRHPLLTERDAENYVAALGEVRAHMEEAITEARRLEAKNIIPPKFILQATVKQMQGFIDPSPGQNPFVTVFDGKMAAIKSLPDAKRQQLRSAAEKVVGDDIYPAWKKAIALLEVAKRKSDRRRRPLADERRSGRLRVFPASLHHHESHGRRNSRNRPQARRANREPDGRSAAPSRPDRWFGEGPHREAQTRPGVSESHFGGKPRANHARYRWHSRRRGKRAALLFDLRPKSPIVAQPFPRFREANAAANYNPPAPDGSRPGTFQYPRRIEKMTKFGLRSTVYHETVPGHHFQIALQVENKDLPRFRQISAFGGISALSEGWGLYAERLAAESGWYGDDIEGLLGQLDSELFRARRLVVDTGLHAMKWTRQQGIDYGIEASEVERYTVFPGQACSYMIGELKIIELREKAKKALGDKFSLREYHNAVLRTGTVPLDLLERQVDAYIHAASATA